MPITFGSPIHLLLLLLVPVVIYLGQRSLAGLSKTRRRLALFIRCSCVILVILALAEVQWRRVSDTLQVVFLLDRSRSIPEEQREDSFAIVNEARRLMDPKSDRARLIVFGKDAYIEGEIRKDGPSIQHVQSIVGRDQTDIARGIDYALNSFQSGVKKRIVLITDGNETTGVSESQASLAKDRDVVIDVVPLNYKLTKEVFVEKVVLPNEVKVGEPYEVRAVVRSLAKTKATLELYEDGQIVDKRELMLEPGVRVEKFPRILKKTGFFNVHALIRAEGQGDTIYQNNQAFGFVYVRGESKVLYLHGRDTGETKALMEAMSLERINYVNMPAAELPQDESILQQYDAIIMDNVPKYELTLKQQKAIARSVKNQGLGLVMIGGPGSYGAGGYEDEPLKLTPIEQALPVYMEPKQKTIIPNGALAIIMHSCEFANGNDWGRKVTMKSIDTLSAKDYVGVIFYDMNGSRWLFPMQKAKNKRLLKNKVKGMDPGDMPDFDSSMRLGINALVKQKAAMRHMIILSDGDPSAPAQGILKKARDNKITITTIAIAPHGGKRGPEVSLMKRIAAATGGKFYFLSDPSKLPKIFIRETRRVARPLIRNIQFPPRVRADSPIIAGFKKFPDLYGHVLASPKERATVVLDTPEKEAQPILVHWRYGVGKTVAFTSDASPRWAGAWIQWAGYSNFWGQLIRWISKDVQDASFQVSTKIVGDKGIVVVDAVTEDGSFLNGLTIGGTVTTPGERSEELPVKLKQVSAGRYRGEFPVAEVGNYTLSMLSKAKGDKNHQSFTTGLVFPYSEEYKRTQSNQELLEKISKIANGRVVDRNKAVKGQVNFFDHDLVAETAMEARWQLLFILLLLLFPADVFVRRVMLDYDRIWAWVQRKILGRGQPQAAEAAVSTLDRLRARKTQLRGQQLLKYSPGEGADGDARIAGEGGDIGAAGAGAGASGAAADDAQAKPQTQASDNMSRLLQAKKRARKDFKGEN